MNQFSERYKTFSNTDLLRVIENKKDYKPEAIEAAENEISQRQLSDQELTEAKNKLLAELQEKQRHNENRLETERKIKQTVFSVLDVINPIQKSFPSTEKIIRSLTIVFGIITLYQYYLKFKSVLFMLTEGIGEWDLSATEYILPLIFLPVSTILFWKRKKLGWIILTAYLTNITILICALFFQTWNAEPSDYSVFPQPERTIQILAFLFFGGMLWVLNRKDIKDSFKISWQIVIGTIAATAMLTFLFMVNI